MKTVLFHLVGAPEKLSGAGGYVLVSVLSLLGWLLSETIILIEVPAKRSGARGMS